VDTARFVVQEHTTPQGVHWDLMLEQDGSLLTFRVPCPPEEIASPIQVTKIAGHALRFLTYEGPVQNNTGWVRIADGGTLRIHVQTDTRISFTLSGRTLQGPFALTHIGGEQWSLTPQGVRT
jgi:hypothetical protein